MVGDPYDNAVVESFRGRMQVELLNRRRWSTRVHLANMIFEYIEGFHNRRRHGALGWATPLEFETEHCHQTTTPHTHYGEPGHDQDVRQIGSGSCTRVSSSLDLTVA